MLRIVVRLVVASIVILLGIGALEIVAAESGEVVVLEATDAAGATHETRLWIVDDGGQLYLRAGSDAAGWYRLLVERPDVEVQRGDETLLVRAVPEVAARDRVNELMRAKYGWADAYIALLFGRDDAVPIRLEPRPAP